MDLGVLNWWILFIPIITCLLKLRMLCGTGWRSMLLRTSHSLTLCGGLSWDCPGWSLGTKHWRTAADSSALVGTWSVLLCTYWYSDTEWTVQIYIINLQTAALIRQRFKRYIFEVFKHPSMRALSWLGVFPEVHLRKFMCLFSIFFFKKM